MTLIVSQPAVLLCTPTTYSYLAASSSARVDNMYWMDPLSSADGLVTFTTKVGFQGSLDAWTVTGKGEDNGDGLNLLCTYVGIYLVCQYMKYTTRI